MQADPKTVLNLLKTARGQLDGVVRMVEDDRLLHRHIQPAHGHREPCGQGQRHRAQGPRRGLRAHGVLLRRRGQCDVKLAEIEGVIDKLSR